MDRKQSPRVCVGGSWGKKENGASGEGLGLRISWAVAQVWTTFALAL